MDSPLLLLVDDEMGVRESLKMVFCKDFRLIEADSMDTAMPQIHDAKPSIVLLDILMPKTDGIEVLRRIKEIHPRCEVIMLTGLISQQLASQAMSLGAFDFVSKPFDVADLRQKVSQALKKFEQQSSQNQ